MPRVIVFDVNETLLDTRALDPLFTRIFGAASAPVLVRSGASIRFCDHHYRQI